jgi:hypothetical protein
MRIAEYRGSLSQKKRDAAHSFMAKVNEQVAIPGRPHVVAGPEGQVVVFCTFARTGTTARSVRHIMSTASQEIFDSHGVWVVGVPEKKHK